ncbi:MAG: hypothetical protein ACQEW9_03380 [Bacteroidota bacterium]|uniref:CDP-Glycerol:Poly(Glycerophosphate) glycerophosphotransferase n=1 Tax=Algoriphagus faecimaris TaxID=686796 RepID=A0A1G6PV86_9BACT|nr:hypothetical protein [Algoriphagus faecimaris]SDC84033.1 hypothetical protein SAMN04488104_100768 [Algoriphagus faecimaris]
MRICFLIPDGIGIRNYLYSDIIPYLQKGGNEIILWHSLDSRLIELTEQRLNTKFEQFKFVHKADGFLVKLTREAARYARLSVNASITSNPTIMTNWTENASSISGKILFKLARVIGSLSPSFKKAIRLEEIGFSQIRKTKRFEEALRQIKKINPDLVFCTHQRVYSVTPEIEAAKSLGIRTSTAIFSWDNLPKARLPFKTDQYLVWSDFMKSEMAMYYPEIAQENIKVTGTPQFDFYFKKELILSKSEFAKKFKLNPEKNWVCFSGCDSLTSPNDPKYLRDVATALAADSDIQLIVRPVPVEPVRRFEVVLKEFPELILAPPKWEKGNNWGSYFPLFEDLIDLVNLAYHCKVVLNMGSTMALDFSVFGNLAFYLNYDHLEKPKNWSVETIYKFQHFESMKELQAVEYIYSPDEIYQKVKEGLESPGNFAPDRKKWLQRIVQPDSNKSASERIAEALIEAT